MVSPQLSPALTHIYHLQYTSPCIKILYAFHSLARAQTTLTQTTDQEMTLRHIVTFLAAFNCFSNMNLAINQLHFSHQKQNQFHKVLKAFWLITKFMPPPP